MQPDDPPHDHPLSCRTLDRPGSTVRRRRARPAARWAGFSPGPGAVGATGVAPCSSLPPSAGGPLFPGHLAMCPFTGARGSPAVQAAGAAQCLPRRRYALPGHARRALSVLGGSGIREEPRHPCPAVAGSVARFRADAMRARAGVAFEHRPGRLSASPVEPLAAARALPGRSYALSCASPRIVSTEWSARSSSCPRQPGWSTAAALL